jgi:ATP-dependent DNA helicase RecQ
MIHREQVQPQQILVLAYNRAVAVEVKARLRKLFRRLGYQNVINGLAVHTFDGFAMKLIPAQAKAILEAAGPGDKPFQEILERVISIHKKKPGDLTAQPGSIKYVLVDEFQDVNELRMEVLTTLFPHETHHLLAIGDPNQSIYGYDREEVSPRPMYESFQKNYHPNTYSITTNFRSLPDILTHAEAFLARNADTFEMPRLKAFWKVPEGYQNPYVENYSFPTDQVKWYEKLASLLKETNRDKKAYRQIAIMARTNEEVYLALRRVQGLGLDPKKIRIRIQGIQSGSFLKIREIAYLVDELLRPSWDEALGGNFLKEVGEKVAASELKFKQWDSYLLQQFWALALEFLESADQHATGEDLFTFMEDLTRREDGQLSQVYHRHRDAIGGAIIQTEIVLTTIHKVKGLEYDAVILPPSFAPLPYNPKPPVVAPGLGGILEALVKLAPPAGPFLPGTLEFDLLEEERRLRYVAMTRAKDRLIISNYEREAALEAGEAYAPPPTLATNLGKPIRGDLSNIILSFVAWRDTNSMHLRLESQVRPGDGVVLERGANNWWIKVKGAPVGLTSKGFHSPFEPAVRRITGLFVANVIKVTREEAEEAGFVDHWKPWAIAQGYTYYLSFAGYAKPG